MMIAAALVFAAAACFLFGNCLLPIIVYGSRPVSIFDMEQQEPDGTSLPDNPADRSDHIVRINACHSLRHVV